jgi:catechol 2,3-dioxygenase-like lactoylglutathione lyase family enzyme
MTGRRNERFDIQGINHIALVCKDMKRTVDFYSGVLGMPLTKTINLPNGMGQHFFFDAATAIRWHSSGFPMRRKASPASRTRPTWSAAVR